MLTDKKVLVVCGGISSEREVSLRSGHAIFEALKKKGYHNAQIFDLKGDNVQDIVTYQPDIVFLGLHGKGGEDGTIQGFLELLGIPYTGPGVCCSSICMDKIATKMILSGTGLPTARFKVLDKQDVTDWSEAVNNIINEFGFPIVLKSPCQGSSIGIEIARNEEEMKKAIQEIFKLGDKLLVEQYLDGIEVTLPILGNNDLLTLPIIEISSERDYYDYTAKYTVGFCHHIIPACIDSATEKRVNELGIQAYRVLNCCGLSRVDFIIDKILGPMIIEVNTLPGMTEMSLFPDAARYMGMSFEDLVERILIYGFETKRYLS